MHSTPLTRLTAEKVDIMSDTSATAAYIAAEGISDPTAFCDTSSNALRHIRDKCHSPPVSLSYKTRPSREASMSGIDNPENAILRAKVSPPSGSDTRKCDDPFSSSALDETSLIERKHDID